MLYYQKETFGGISMRLYKREKKFDNVVHDMIFNAIQDYRQKRLTLKHKFYLLRKNNKKMY